MASSPNLFVVLVFLVLFVFQTQGWYFTRGPYNLTVYEGQNATFTTESQYATVCKEESKYFTWHSHGRRGVSSCTPTSEFRAGQGRLRLTIQNTQPEDSGEYWCVLVFHKPYYVEKSSHATLTVLPLPEYNPSCTFEPTRPAVGTETTLKCALSTQDPVSSLTYLYDFQTGFDTQLGTQRYTQPGELYSLQRMLTEYDNMREFTCVAGPNSGPSCSITPLQIPTTVSISPSHLTRHEHENASFTCDFRSIPQQRAASYEWRVLKDGILEVDVNQAVLQNLEGQFELENGGRTLQIINVTLEEFHNAQIRCIASLYDGTDFTSDNESLLIVLPLTSTATDQSLTTTATERTSDKNNAMNTVASSTVFIVVGVLGAIFFLIIIALLGRYLIKYKHKPTGPGQTAVAPNQNPTIYEIVVTDGDESGPTYDQVPVDQTGEQNRQIPSDFTTQAEVLYTLPDKTGPEIRRYVVSSSSAIDNDGGTVCIDNEESIYTMPEKGPRSRPIISDTEDIGPQQKNVEGLAYAELDLQPSQSATQTKSVDQSTYADICTEY